MILQKYTSYKNSGIEGLGKISKDLNINHLKRILEIKITDGPHETPTFIENGVPFISAEAIQNGTINFNSKRGYISEELDKLYSLKCKAKKEDILLVKSGSTTGKIGYVNTSENFSIWSPLALIRINTSNSPRFYFYFLSSTFFQNLVQRFWSFGTQPNIGMNVLENLFILEVNKKEQIKMAKYLDEKTSQIDSKIKFLQEKITSYKELKKTTINETVCRGLNKNIELKDSEIEWIGEIPKHWKIKRLKDNFNLISSGINIFDGEKDYLSTKSISINEIEQVEEVITYKKRPSRANMQPRLNSVWFAKLRFTNKSYLFVAFEEIQKYILSTGFAGLLNKKNNNKFSCYYIMSEYFLYQKDRFCYGTTQEAITEPNINQIIFIDPPNQEQIQIAEYLDEKTSKMDSIILKTKDQIKTLREFRKTLINDIVMGKVRVQDE